LGSVVKRTTEVGLCKQGAPRHDGGERNWRESKAHLHWGGGGVPGTGSRMRAWCLIHVGLWLKCSRGPDRINREEQSRYGVTVRRRIAGQGNHGKSRSGRVIDSPRARIKILIKKPVYKALKYTSRKAISGGYVRSYMDTREGTRLNLSPSRLFPRGSCQGVMGRQSAVL